MKKKKLRSCLTVSSNNRAFSNQHHRTLLLFYRRDFTKKNAETAAFRMDHSATFIYFFFLMKIFSVFAEDLGWEERERLN